MSLRRHVGKLAVLASLALGGAPPVLAWGNHSLISYRVFEAMPEVAQAPAVSAEPLERFLQLQELRIERLLAEQESWARGHLKGYAPRPDALRFRAQATRGDAERRAAFLAAMRLAPDVRLALYRQLDPRHERDIGAELPHTQVSTLTLSKGATQHFVALQPGQSVSALAVLASACDEPDYGLDIGLFEDNGRPAGRLYGFGRQPFGNPAMSNSSQAPFHMAFFHQGALFERLAPAFARTFAAWRVEQYRGLARLAFETGHPYWGWRFAGWALHHVQDLTQPYHASAAPGSSTAGMVWAELLAKLGMPERKRGLIVLQSNRHFVLEKYQTQLLLAAAREGRDGAIERALRDAARDDDYGPWRDDYVVDVVARQAHAEGPQTDAAVVTGAPLRYVLDPAFDFGASESGIDLDTEMRTQLLEQRERFQQAIARLLGHLGAHSRNLLRSVLTKPYPSERSQTPE